MNIKFIPGFLISLICLAAFGQSTKGTLYEAGEWADTKGKGNLEEAMENLTVEKVEILVTSKIIKATFGSKVYTYLITSTKSAENETHHTVTHEGKTYVITITDWSELDGTFTIYIEKLWMVPTIYDISTVDVR